MADEERTIIIDVEVEDKDFDKEIGEVNNAIKNNRAEIKELSKDYKNNATEIAKLEAENRDLAQSKRTLIKESKTEKGSLNELRLELAKQTKERNELNKSSDEGAARFAELQKSIAGLNEEISGFEEEGGDFRRNVGNYPSLAGNASGAIKGLWTTLLANPLILIVTALAGLVKVFSETQAGAEFFRKTGAALSASLGLLKDIVEFLGVELIKLFENPKQALKDFANLIKENIINRFEGLVELIPQLAKAINLLFKLEFAEAGKVALDAVAKVTLGVEDFTEKVGTGIEAVVEFGKKIKETAETAGELEASMIANEKALADLRVEQAQSLQTQKELNRTIEDQTKSFEDRIAAAIKFGEVEDAQAAKAIELQEKRIALLIKQNEQTNSTEEDIQRVRDAQIELANLQAASDERQVTNANKLFGIRQQQESQRQKDSDAEFARIAELENAQADAFDEEVARDLLLLQTKQQAGKQAIESIIGNLRVGSKLAKAAALTQVAIDTGKAISALTAASQANPANAVTFGAAGALQFAAGIIQILANIAKARQIIKSGKGGGGGAAASPVSSSIGGGGGGQPGGLANVNGALLSQFSNAPQDQAAQNNAITQGISNLQPVVAVVDINTGIDNRAVKVSESELG